MTSVPNQGDPCACGSVDTWHPECYTLKEGREAEIQRLRALMAEAVRDFHGKAVLFSAAFLTAAEPPKMTRSQKMAAKGYKRRPTWRSLPSDE